MEIGWPVLGPVGGVLFILFFPYIQMARGRLVPRAALEDVRAAAREAVVASNARSDDWKGTADAWQATARELGAQNTQLLEFARTGDHVLRSIRERVDQDEAAS